MYDVSTQGVDERMVNVHYYYCRFVCLQLYMLPAVSSFKLTETVDEDLNVLQQPTIIVIIITFIVSGPALHVIMTWAGTSALGVFSLPSLVSTC